MPQFFKDVKVNKSLNQNRTPSRQENVAMNLQRKFSQDSVKNGRDMSQLLPRTNLAAH